MEMIKGTRLITSKICVMVRTTNCAHLIWSGRVYTQTMLKNERERTCLDIQIFEYQQPGHIKILKVQNKYTI